MVKIVHIEIATDPKEPFQWVADDKAGSLYAFHKVIEERQCYLLRVSNLLSHLGSMNAKTQNHLIEENIFIFFKRQPEQHIQVSKNGRWTTYKQGSLTIMTEETA